MSKKILVIGAGYLQSFIIKRAKEMGYFTLAVDVDPNAPGFVHADKYGVINIIDQEACLAFAKENKIDGVITAATDYGVLTASYVAKEMGLIGIDYEAAKRIKNKYLVRKCLIENNFRDVDEQFYIVKSTDEASKLKDKLHYPIMVKPCDGSGSRGTSKVNNPEDLLHACKKAIESSIIGSALIETFFNGKEYGVESIVVNGEVHVLGVMKKQMTNPPYFAELRHSIPSGLSIDIKNKVREYVTNVIRLLKINTGAVNIDLLVNNEGKPHLVDIGARMGGNMIGARIIPLSTGIDYMGAIIKTALAEPVDLNASKNNAVVSRLLAFQGGTVKKLPDFEKMQKEYDVEIYHHLKVGQVINEYHTNLDGCGYVIASSKNIDECNKKVDDVFSKIQRSMF